MEHVLAWMVDVRFPYDRRRTSVVRQHNGARLADEERRRAWLLSAKALIESRKPDVKEKVAWLTLSTRYMAADHVSGNCIEHGSRDRMLHRQAAEIVALKLSQHRTGR